MCKSLTHYKATFGYASQATVHKFLHETILRIRMFVFLFSGKDARKVDKKKEGCLRKESFKEVQPNAALPLFHITAMLC